MKTCPVCQRKFATKQALKQHMESVHKASGSTAPRSTRAKNMLSTTDPSIRITRTEWLHSVTASNTSDKITDTVVCPATSSIAVLSKLGGMFEKFVVHKMTLIYRGSAGATKDGMVFLAVDYDAVTTAPNTKADVLKMAFKSCLISTREMAMPVSSDSAVRYVDGSDKRDKFVRALTCTTNRDSGTTVGELFVTYDITFSGMKP